MALSLRALFLIAIFVLLSPAFIHSKWVQTVEITVQSKNGVPLPDAKVQIIYQKSNSLAENDGLVEGTTGSDGKFLAKLANSVPPEYESRKIQIKAEAFGWSNISRTAASEAEGLNVTFTAPFDAEVFEIAVFDSDGSAVEGAEVYVTSQDLRLEKRTDSSGKVALVLPSGMLFSGFAYKGARGEYFESKNAANSSFGKAINVSFTYKGDPQSQGKDKKKVFLRVKFLSLDGLPFSGGKVEFLHNGQKSSKYTDASGFAELEVDANSNITAMAKVNDYLYSFDFKIGSAENQEETAQFYPLLKIDEFKASNIDSEGCYRVYAKISDPRLNRPISVRMAQYGKNGTYIGEISTFLDENGFYSGKVCANREILVKVEASNAYEKTQRTFPISLQEIHHPAETQSPPGQNSAQAQSQHEASEIPFAYLALILVLALVLVGAAAILAMKKKSSPADQSYRIDYKQRISSAISANLIRPVLEYLRSLASTIKKREPPPQAKK